MVLLIGFMPGLVWALDPAKTLDDYRYEEWSEQQGLPFHSINRIAQTGNGYLWIATYYGLVRFDGKTFVVFDSANTPAITSNRVWAVAADRDGDLFIGTAGGLVHMIENRFERVALPGAGTAAVRTLELAANGEMLIGTEGKGAYIMRDHAISRAGPSDLNVRSLAQSPDGTVWIGSSTGLFSCIHARCAALHTADGLPDEKILALAVFGPRLAIGTRTGLAWVDLAAPHFQAKRDPRFDSRSIAALRTDSASNLWFSALGEGVGRFGRDGLQFAAQVSKPVARSVMCLFEDREGGLWMGTGGAGIARFRDAAFRTMTVNNGLLDDVVHAITAGADGTLWVGLNTAGLNQVSADGTVIASYSKANGLPSNDVFALERAAKGGVWVGGYDGSIARVEGGSVNRMALPRDWPNAPVLSLFEDADGTLWAGLLQAGLVRLKDGKATYYRHSDGLAGTSVRDIHRDRTGRMWLATNGGISRFDGQRFENFNTHNGLSGDDITALYEDSSGTMWIAAFGSGLMRYRRGEFKGFGAHSGLAGPYVLDVAEDARGYLWLGTNVGVLRATKNALDAWADRQIPVHPDVFSIADGLRTRESSSGHSIVRMPGGKMWVATMKGLSVTDPGRMPVNRLQPPVKIERVAVDGKEIQIGHAERLSPGTHNVEFQFTALSLRSPDQVEIRYRLSPLEKDWTSANQRRSAQYSALPAGSYRFQVIAANNDGVWNLAGDSIAIEIPQHFYLRWWFLLLSSAAAVAAAKRAYSARTLRLRTANAELERRVVERTASLEAANREMSTLIENLEIARAAAESATRARTDFIANMSHEIRTPMNGILGLVGLTLNSELNPTQRENLRLTEQSAQGLLHVLNDVLDFSKIDAGHLRIDHEVFELNSVVHDAINLMTPRAASKGIALNAETAPDLPVWVNGDPTRLRQVLLNLIGNAVKFTDAGSAQLKAAVEECDQASVLVRFTVRDTGAGIESSQLSRIFDPFVQVDTSTHRRHGGTGLGLAISRRLVLAMQGRIWVQSELGKGSTFSFTARFGLASAPLGAIPTSAAGPAASGTALSVLLVEDNVVNQLVASSILKHHGCRVDIAADGQIAVERTAQHRYDLIVMDVQMPVMDGLEATREIRRQEQGTGRHVPIVALTAHAMAGDEDRCIASGMDAYMTKPVQPPRIAALLERVARGEHVGAA